MLVAVEEVLQVLQIVVALVEEEMVGVQERMELMVSVAEAEVVLTIPIMVEVEETEWL